MQNLAAAEIRDGLFDGWLVADVSFHDDQGAVADRLHAFQRLPTAVAEIIQNYNILAGAQKLDANVRADIPGAPGDQYHEPSCLAQSISVRYNI
jgi:hypothetical protein